MSDRELLELAAKAAGTKIYESTDGTIQNRPVWVFKAGGGMGTMPYEERWNPLRDDSQALRLAVKLRLTVEQWFWGQEALVYDFRESTIHEGLGVSVHEPYGTDPLAATRRAIVRAAAEIGRNMP